MCLQNISSFPDDKAVHTSIKPRFHCRDWGYANGKKPTYQKLEQRVLKLEKQAVEHNKAKEELQRHVAELERSNQELTNEIIIL